jgi:hypothetical protein
MWPTWPFAMLEADDERRRIRAVFIKLDIPLEDIDEVTLKTGLLRRVSLRGDEVTIRHHADNPNPVVFRSFNSKRLVQLLRRNGVAVASAA